jgi:hypothetical protein
VEAIDARGRRRRRSRVDRGFYGPG